MEIVAMFSPAWIRAWMSRSLLRRSPHSCHRPRPAHRRTLRLLFEVLEERSVPATITWVNPAGGDWDTASNWSSGTVPGAGDDVVISSLNSSSSITRASGAAITVQNLTFSGGTLTGTEDITVTGTFTWTGGTLSGGGSLTAAGGADLSGNAHLSGYTLVIPPGQSATLQDLTALYDGAVLDNQGTLTLNGTGPYGYGAVFYDGGPSLLKNEGTIHTNQDSQLGVPIDSPGDIVVDDGSLSLGYSQNVPPYSTTSTFGGRIDATRAAGLVFLGQATLAATSSVDATTVSFYGPTQVAGSYSATYTAVNGGPVTGTGTVAALSGLSISQNCVLDLTAATLAPGSTDVPSLTVGISAHLLAAADWTVSGPLSLMGFIDAAGGRGSLTAVGGADLSGFVVALSGYTLVIPPGQSATLEARTDLKAGSVLDNQGTLTLNGTGYFDTGLVEGAAPALLENEGTIHTNQNSQLLLPVDSPGDIVVDNGSLSLGYANQYSTTVSTFGGRIDATNATSIQFSGRTTLSPTSSVDATGVTFTGPTQVAGSYRAAGTAVNTVNEGPVTFTGMVAALGDLSIQGTTLDLTAATLAPGATDLPSLTVVGRGTLRAGAEWTVSGPVSLSGTGGNLDAAGGSGSLTAAGGADLSGIVSLRGYTLVIPPGQSATLEARTDLLDGSVLDNQGTLTLNGSGYGSFDIGLVQYNGGDGGAPALLHNEGTIHTNQNSQLLLPIDSPGDIVVDSGSLGLGYANQYFTTVSTFGGRIDATNATGVAFNGQTTLAPTSSVDATSVTFTGPTQVAGSYSATYTAVNGGPVTVTGTVAALGGLSISQNCVLDLTAATLAPGAAALSSLDLAGTLVLASNISVNSPFIVQNGARLRSPNSSAVTATVGLTVGQATLDGVQLIVPSGASAAWTSGTITVANAGAVDLFPGATFGSAGNTSTLSLNGGTLEGSGTVNANVSNNGQVNPGGTAFVGVLAINGNYSQTSSGILNIDIGGLILGSQFDQLNVSGSVGLDGTLNVNLLTPFTGVCGSSFPVLTFVSRAGDFATESGLTQPYNLTFTPAYTAANLTLTVSQIASTTAVTASANPSVYGQPVTFTATVSPAPIDIDTPTGTVQFQIDGNNVGSPVALSGGTAGITVSSLSTGPHTVTAVYSGDGSFFTSAGSLAQTVNPDSTTTTLTSSVNPSFLGQAVTLSAAVGANAPGAGTPTGSVDFLDTTTGQDLGSVTLSGATAMVSTSALGFGTHVIQATYGGDGNFLPSNTTLTQVVVGSVYVLNTSIGGALTLSGNASIHVAGNVVVDSSSNTALTESGNAQVSAASIQVVGGVQQSGNATLSPVPVTGAASVPDPLAGLNAPTGGTFQGSVNLSDNTSLTINPGIYTQIKVSGNGRLTLNPGDYILAGGGLTVTGSGSLTGNGVLIYNAGSNFPTTGGNYGGVTLGGNGTISLTGASGPDAGVVLFQARDNNRAIALGGNAVAGISGTIYAPAALLTVGGNPQVTGSLVVNRLQLTGNGGSTLETDGGAGSDSSVGELVAGDLALYVDNSGGPLSSDELARIDDAVAVYNALLVPYNVTITQVSSSDQANVVLSVGTTSACGGLAEGVLGCYAPGTITLLQGWSFYAGADPSAIGTDQYDFEALVLHEMGHSLGLGHSPDPNSVMYATLATGGARRTPTAADLNIGDTDGRADAEHAAFVGAAAGDLPASPGVARPLAADEALDPRTAVSGGGTGEETLSVAGSTANNVVVGGEGAILIGGWTDYDLSSTAMTHDQKLAALAAILAEGGSTDSYTTRVNALLNGGGLNGSYLLNASTVHENGQDDTLSGIPGPVSDWFFAGVSDIVKHKNTGEVQTAIF
jgi:hypothetical protein